MVKLLLVNILLTKKIVENLEGDAYHLLMMKLVYKFKYKKKSNLICMENFSGNLDMDCSTMFRLFPVGLSMDLVA